MLARAVTFYAIACALSWGIYAALSQFTPLPPTLILAIYMFGPLLAALATARLFDRGRMLDLIALGARWSPWWIVAWATPVAACIAAWGVTLALPGATAISLGDGIVASVAAQGLTLPPEQAATLPPGWVVLVLAATVGGAINTLFAIGEEAGWRGYLWSVLRPLGFWPTCLIVGVAWGLWHAPAIAAGHNYGIGYAGYPWAGIGMMTLFTLGLTPAMGYLRERTGSAWPAALFHGVINALGSVFALLVSGVAPLLAGVAGLAGVIVLAALTLVVSVLRPDAGPSAR